jgi:spermidine/putrescine transport system substrate-binding protein
MCATARVPRRTRNLTAMAGPGAPNEPGLSRRGFLRGAGLGAAGLALGGPALLAACSNGTTVTGGGTVRVVNQPLMIDDNSPKLFEASSGVTLDYSEYTDAMSYLAQHRAAFEAHRAVGADVLILPDEQTEGAISAGWVRPLGAIGARGRVLPAFANPAFDPGRRYSIPYASTQIGLAYDNRRVPAPVTSARAIFDPAFAGKVVLSADSAATIGMVMLASGQDPATVTDAQEDAAFTRVRAAVAGGQIRSFATTEGLDDLVSGEALLTIARSADVRLARVISPHLRFVVPSEGGLLSSLNMVVPAVGAALDPAEAFIDYMASPAPNSRIASFVNMVPTVVNADRSLQTIDVKAAADPLVVPPPAVWKRLRIFGRTPRTGIGLAGFATFAAAHAG